MGIRKLGVSIAFVLTLGLAAPMPVLAAPAASVHQGCIGVHGRLVCNGHSVRRPTPYRCFYISRQTVEMVAWGEIAEGGLFSAAGLLADGTIVGIPLGAFLGLIGIAAGGGGSFLLWWGDTYFRPGWYCGYV